MDFLSEPSDKAAYLTGGDRATAISREQESARKTWRGRSPRTGKTQGSWNWSYSDWIQHWIVGKSPSRSKIILRKCDSIVVFLDAAVTQYLIDAPFSKIYAVNFMSSLFSSWRAEISLSNRQGECSHLLDVDTSILFSSPVEAFIFVFFVEILF